MGITRDFSSISDDGLDRHFREFRQQYPKSGYRYFTGYLRSKPRQLRLQRDRIRAAILRVDGVGARLRTRDPIIRKSYENPRPNAVWHVDGHLKAVDWGITVHEFIDGHSRKVSFSFTFNNLSLRKNTQIMALRASSNNYASTVFNIFTKAIRRYGRPSRVHGDRGNENLLVATDMNYHRGNERASFMWGRYVSQISQYTPIEMILEDLFTTHASNDFGLR